MSVNSHQENDKRGAYRRADRQRQVGAGACACRNDRRRRSSMPIPCRSIAICACSPRGRRREEEARVPHRLYGHVDAAVNFSAGAWVADAAKVLAEARAQNRLPIFVGGSGLYFKALTRGLSAVPPIPPEMRDRRARAAGARRRRGAACGTCCGAIRRRAERLKPRDRTRIARALEVVEATGRSLTDWHREGLPPLLPPGQFTAVFLDAGARRALCADRRAFRRDAGSGRAGRGRGAGGAQARSAAAGDEGAWRAGADPAS